MSAEEERLDAVQEISLAVMAALGNDPGVLHVAQESVQEKWQAVAAAASRGVDVADALTEVGKAAGYRLGVQASMIVSLLQVIERQTGCAPSEMWPLVVQSFTEDS